MSTRIMMALVMNLIPFLFSAALVHSDQSFTVSENVTYDCIDIYKQPGLNHPLLKNHTIQMKPSVSSHESMNQTSNNKTYKKKIRCPDGTVPILRNSKEHITKAQVLAEKYFHPLTGESPGTHISGVRSSKGPYRGVEAWFSAYALNIGQDQASYSQIYIGSGSNKEVNFIQVGFMINPSVFGDGRVWSYGYWKGKDGKGCYNTACPGFIQVSHEIFLAGPNDLKPGVPIWWHCSIHQDIRTGNWWITQLSDPHVDIGYWPKELFNILENGGDIVGVGGVVQASRSGSSPPMGNGNFPTGGYKKSAVFTSIGVLDSYFGKHRMDYFPIEKLVDSPQCYGLTIGKAKPFQPIPPAFFFNFGGPGGNSCGV